MANEAGIYSTLPNKRSIRVFDLEQGDFYAPIRGCLRPVDLDENPEFTAVSYAWGDLHITKPIFCKPFKSYAGHIECYITLNLHDCLRRCRLEDHSICLWVDALCINQNDNKEKSWQIQLMAQVFTSSKNTIVWLGELDCAEEAYDQLRGAEPNALALFRDHCSRLRSAGKATLRDVECGLIIKLCAQPYFQRKWIIQEVILAKSAMMLCSAARMTWSDFTDTLRSLVNLGALPVPEENLVAGQILAMPDSPYDDPRHRVICISQMMQLRGTGIRHLLQFMHFAATSLCVDARDHLYAVLAIGRGQEALAITPNYDLGPEKVYQDLAIIALLQKRSRLSLLLYNTDRSRPSALDTPSWVPDWTRIDPGDSILQVDDEWSHFQATRDLPAELTVSENCSILQIRGIRLCEVSADTVLPLFDRLFDPAESDPVWLSSRNSADWRLHNWFQQCVLTAKKATITDKDVLDTTITCGLLQHRPAFSISMEHGITAYERFESLAAAFDEYSKSGADKLDSQLVESLKNALDPVVFMLMTVGLRRRFFVTSTGLCGMGPRDMRAGDSVCLFYGGDVPYVLRPDAEGTYTFVGHCYLHGMMFGEGLDLGIAEEMFKIR